MKLLLCLMSMLWAASAYKILLLNPLPSKSHYHLGKGIVRSLLKNNHEVTWVTAFPDKDSQKNLTIVDVSSIRNGVGSLDRVIKGLTEIKMLTRNISLAMLNHAAVRKVIVNEQFDAVISEWFMTDMEAGYAAIQQAPWILISSIAIHPHLEALVDTAKSISTIPLMMTNFNLPMSFPERLLNTLLHWLFRLDNWIESFANEALYESYFTPLAKARGVLLPPFSAALHNISILLVNSHPSFAAAQSLPPNVVEVGGYHIDEDVPPLPKDLQGILDSSPQGVIYFSLGSVVKTSALSKKLKQDLINLFSKLPYTVLWKLDEEIQNLPKNIHIKKWMPQNSILAHPNVKIFMSHSGLLSNMEALYFGIPMLAIPVFGDQPRNAADSVKAGRAIRVEFSPDMVPKIKKALKEMTENDRYYKTAKHLSKLFRARPIGPSKLVSSYIELAIETGGAVHLRSKALLYNWYEVQNIDVMAAVLAILIILYYVCKKLFRIARTCFTKSSKDKSVDKNKKKK